MKAKINEKGSLMLERAGKFKLQDCPFNKDNFCGDSCPLFREEINPNTEEILLELCMKSHLFKKEDFIDEREKTENEIPKIYIILLWFWEGDGFLVNSYLDCYSNKEDAIEFAKVAKKRNEADKVYLPGEKIPKEEDGEYGSKPFIQVVEIPLK